MELKPLDDKVVVKLEKVIESKTEFGLIIPGSAEEKPTEGVVVAVGPGLRLDNGQIVTPDVSVGDKVLFAKYQGTPINENGEELLILAYRDVLAVLEK